MTEVGMNGAFVSRSLNNGEAKGDIYLEYGVA